MTNGIWYKLPPRFIQDCQECDCDVGEWSANGQFLKATPEQLAELRSRAEFYADAHGPDVAPPGLKVAAKAVLRALEKLGQ